MDIEPSTLRKIHIVASFKQCVFIVVTVNSDMASCYSLDFGCVFSQIEDRRRPQMTALARGARRLESENRLEERATADDRKFDQDER